MSWLKAIVGGAIGAEALTLIKDYIEKQGGLDAVVKDFQTGGFKKKVDSWVSTGANEAISGIEVGQAVGIEKLKKLAESAGVDVNKARDLLAEYLPVAIDKATPQGKLPEEKK
ncbi:MAG: YidB family protein [Methylocystis sp.]|uniref:YidB family protein n=1 Tax=Methylocystis sp. TaxID=1911079 RepID=UPI003DA4C77D